jgi:magnesium chelatase family protein
VGLEGVIVEVEVDYTNGLPAVIIVGLPDAAVQESRERVQTAVKNAGLEFPASPHRRQPLPRRHPQRRTRLRSAHCIGVVILAGFLPQESIEGAMFVGELSLDGVVRHTRGVLPMAAAARANGFKRMFVPEVRCGRSGFDARPGSVSGQIACASLRPSIWSASH